MVYRMRALLPFAGMIMVILIQVGNMVASKAAMSRGMNKYVLIVYSNALSSLFLLPCSVMFHRYSHLFLLLPLILFCSCILTITHSWILLLASDHWQNGSSTNHLLCSLQILLACPHGVCNMILFIFLDHMRFWCQISLNYFFIISNKGILSSLSTLSCLAELQPRCLDMLAYSIALQHLGQPCLI